MHKVNDKIDSLVHENRLHFSSNTIFPLNYPTNIIQKCIVNHQRRLTIHPNLTVTHHWLKHHGLHPNWFLHHGLSPYFPLHHGWVFRSLSTKARQLAREWHWRCHTIGMIVANTDANGEEFVTDAHLLHAVAIGETFGKVIKRYSSTIARTPQP